MIEVVKKINQLTFDDINKIFLSAFPDIKDVLLENDTEYKCDDDCIIISNSIVGYSITIWNDYQRICVNSDVYPMKVVRLLDITNTLFEIGALKLKSK
jgi:hypothetical protein